MLEVETAGDYETWIGVWRTVDGTPKRIGDLDDFADQDTEEGK